MNLKYQQAGRLVEQKNYSLLIKAVSLVREKYPEVRCYIYGDGALKQELKQQIFQLGLENNVFLPGNKKDVNKWVSKSSIFVMSSNYEGLSNALIEAMMQGKACISTDYPGANELIDNGKNGIIVPIGNYKELANSIITLFENKDIRQKLGKEAMVDSIKFKKENVIGQWKCVISKIIKRKGDKMNLLILTDKSYPYGSAYSSRVRHFVKAFHEIGYKITMISANLDIEEAKTFGVKDIEYISMNYPQNRITQLGIGVAYKYKKVLEKFLKGKKYDAIFVNSITYALPVICELAKKIWSTYICGKV